MEVSFPFRSQRLCRNKGYQRLINTRLEEQSCIYTSIVSIKTRYTIEHNNLYFPLKEKLIKEKITKRVIRKRFLPISVKEVTCSSKIENI
jgi:hypothetical protein